MVETQHNETPEPDGAPAPAEAPVEQPVEALTVLGSERRPRLSGAAVIRSLDEAQFRAGLPDFGPGDTVRVAVRVVEGDRERIQNFEGVVIRRQGRGLSETFLVRRIASHGIGVERNFLVHSPRLESITVLRRARVHRAALYYLRGRTGRAARLKERRT